jgi:hypothetical protein
MAQNAQKICAALKKIVHAIIMDVKKTTSSFLKKHHEKGSFIKSDPFL